MSIEDTKAWLKIVESGQDFEFERWDTVYTCWLSIGRVGVRFKNEHGYAHSIVFERHGDDLVGGLVDAHWSVKRYVREAECVAKTIVGDLGYARHLVAKETAA